MLELIAAETTTLPSTGGYMLRFVVSVLLVCALAVLSTRFLGNKLAVRTGGRLIKVIDTVPVGKGKWLCVARVGTRSLLLGVSDQTINVLTELAAGDVVDNEHYQPHQSGFFDRLVKVVKKQETGTEQE